MTTVTYSDPQPFGRGDAGGQYTARYAQVGEDSFVEVGGVFYDQCGRCEVATPGTTIYTQVFGGLCFSCNGVGRKGQVATSEAAVVKVAARRAKARAKAAAKREAEATAKAAERAAALAEWAYTYPAAAEAAALVLAVRPEYDPYGDDPSGETFEWTEVWGRFACDLAERSQWHALSQAQSEALVEAVREAYDAMMAKAAKAEASRYLDVAEGAKVAVTGTVEVAMSVPTSDHFGRPSSSMLVVVKGTGEFEGVTVKAFGSGQTLWSAEKGQDVTMAGSVKKFEEYEGVKQTVLTRAKVTAA